MLRSLRACSVFATFLGTLAATEGCTATQVSSPPPATPAAAVAPAPVVAVPPAAPPAAAPVCVPAPTPPAAVAATSSVEMAKPPVAVEQKPATPVVPERPISVSIVEDPPVAVPKEPKGKKPAHAAGARHAKAAAAHTAPHATPHFVLDVVASEGQPALERTVRNGAAPLRSCYDAGLRRDQELSGRLEVELGLTDDGRVERTKLLATTLSDQNVEMCIVREAAALNFGAAGSSARTFVMHATLSPGDEPVAAPTTLPHSDKLVESLQKVRPEIEQCYRDGIARKPALGGMLSLKFKVRPSGEVFEVGETETHFGDVDTTRCITRVFRANKLASMHPAGHGAASKKDTSFIYTLHLENDAPVATTKSN